MTATAKGAYKDPILRRFAAAKSRRDRYNALLSDTYALVLPDADVDGNRTEGAKNDVELFEGQGARSLDKRRDRMMGQLYPPFTDRLVSFEFQAQPLDSIPPELRDQAASYLDAAAEVVHDAVTESNFFIEMPQALADVLVSTGALLVNPGDPDIGPPLVFEAIPISSLVPEEGPFGSIETVFLPRSLCRREVAARWPEAEKALWAVDGWDSKLRDDPDGKVDVIEAQLFEPHRRAYRYVVYLAEGEHKLIDRSLSSKAIIVFRMSKATGEVMGRGPAITCRADLKTANVTKELTLKNASIAVTGIWQADDDGVLNPANIELVPGAIIPKAPGSKGLQPLQAAADFNVSQIIQADLNNAVREAIEGPPMPGYDQDRPVAQAFLTAERERAEVEVPKHTRLFYELDIPLWTRVVDILTSDQFKGSRWHIPPVFIGSTKDGVKLELKPRAENPLARIQKQAQWREQIQALTTAIQLFGPEAVAAEVKGANMMRDFLTEAGGIPPKYLLTAQEKQAAAQQQQAAQQAQMAAMATGVQGAAAMAGTDTGTAVLRDVGKMMGGANG
ncbi:portal protein [Magnetospirillum sulfuroxidans]|uniref:Bacteriophage head to tail connecting protein n=1 Tax=Magnetospirillum sulfuroxidans TaxID=611300 RepID=A0ABS5I975_9PROT|nr:portal protein [Magnetospirillum sulfuroxidans]MBR9970816.1 hypothetical protein [Magnetospirillum sulfuroxidans]